MSKDFTVQQILVGKVSTASDAQFVNATCSVTLVEEKMSDENWANAKFRMLVDCASSYEREKLGQILRTNCISPDDITHLVVTHWHFDHCGNIGLFPNAQLITPERILAEGSEKINGDLPEFVSVHLFGGHSTPGDVVVKVKQTKKRNEKFLPWVTAIVGDLFEFENDWLADQPWKQCSICPDRQLISRFLCWKGTDEIIPGHGSSFRTSETFPEKASFALPDSELISKPLEKGHENDHSTIGNAFVSELFSFFYIDEQQKRQKLSVYLVKEKRGEVMLVNTGGPTQGQALVEAMGAHGIAPDDVKYLVITNLGVQFCHNLYLFKNAKAFMSTDIAFPNSNYGSLDKLFVISSNISIWRDMDPIRDAGTLSVLVRTTVNETRECFTLIGSKLDMFIPLFLGLTNEQIGLAKVVCTKKTEK